jgi:predicted nucleotidyltransferase
MPAAAVTFAAIPAAKRRLLDEIVDSLRPTPNLTAIVLGGSHARGTHRPNSDLDIGLVYRPSQPFAIGDIRAIAQKFSAIPAASVVTDFHEWGPWVNGGAWIYNDICKVDLLYRDLDELETTIRGANAGIWRHDFDQQPPFGFRSVIYLGEIACCVPLNDPAGLIAQLKAEIKTYPEALKRRIIGDCLWSVQFTLFLARDFADRADIVNSAGCMTRIAHYFTQALFALNDTYFINDKGATAIIEKFTVRPRQFWAILEAILASPGATPGAINASLDQLEQVLGNLIELAGAYYQPRFVLRKV